MLAALAAAVAAAVVLPRRRAVDRRPCGRRDQGDSKKKAPHRLDWSWVTQGYVAVLWRPARELSLNTTGRNRRHKIRAGS
jgi:hypothetical protein